MTLRILFHDNCFDGLASAGLFSAFHRGSAGGSADIGFTGLSHGPGGGLSDARLDADEHAVVDFGYSSDPRLTWWFDHHRSAFSSPEDEAHFRTDTTGRKIYDPAAPSCTGLMARRLAEGFGFDPRPHEELIHWAEIIDGARFDSPRQAVELDRPALQLMLWIERSRSLDERVELIRFLAQRPLEEAVRLPFVAATLGDQLEEHRRMVAAVQRRCRVERSVVYCDLTDVSLEVVNKFVPYYLHPEAPYAVVVSRSETSAKVSVGYNAWHPPDARRHDISAICARRGGGGHPYVGAVTRTLAETADLVRLAREMVSELNR